MAEPDVFVLADRALARVVGQIAPEQWGMILPDSFTTRSRPERPSLRTSSTTTPTTTPGCPTCWPGSPWPRRGPTSSTVTSWGTTRSPASRRSSSAPARRRRPSRDLDAVAHLSFGDYSVREYFWQINSFRALRAYDLAGVIGVDPALPDALVRGVWDEVSPHAEEWRAIGVYPAAVPVPDDAPLLSRLLGLTGRQPRLGAADRIRRAARA